MSISRRSLLVSTPIAIAGAGLARAAASDEVHDGFPTQRPELVREMVGVSHGNVARVKELLARHPSLARAAYDWGYGDWESALGAASHVGNVEIAQLLLAHGARPNLFSAAMLGQLPVVRALVEANPGAQRIAGPHGISLLAHARAGGERAKAVYDYLEGLGDAGRGLENVALTDAEIERLVGSYRFGTGSADLLLVARISGGMAGQLSLKRGPDGVPRNLFHLGKQEFHPAGAVAVRVRFSRETPAVILTIHDPDPEVVVEARRSAG
jgi:hypothetical protein